MTSPQGLDAGFLTRTSITSAVLENRPQGGLTTWGGQEPVRKPPKIEGSSVFDISEAHAFLQNNQVVDQDLTSLKKYYGFPPNDLVATFLANRRAIARVLLSAVPHLKQYFGADSIVNLEVSTDDDGSQTLYAVVVWRDAVPLAAQALETFSEHWWLDHMTASTADLAFTYEIH